MTGTEDAVRRFLEAEVGTVEQTSTLPMGWVEQAHRRRRVRRQVAGGVVAAALALAAGAAGLSRLTRPTEVETRPAAPTTSTPPESVSTSAPTSAPTSSSTALAPTRPGRAVTIRGDRVVVVDTRSRRELRTLHRLASDREAIAGLTLSPDRRTAYVSVLPPGPESNCSPEVHRIPVDGGAPARETGLGYLPVFSADGTRVAFTSDPAGHGGYAGPGFRCRKAIVVRDLRTGAERWWVEPPRETTDNSSLTGLSWSVDGTTVLFERGVSDPDPAAEEMISELRALPVDAPEGTIEESSTVLRRGRQAMLDGQGRGTPVPMVPVGVAEGGVAFVEYDGNTQLGRIALRRPDGTVAELAARRAVDLYGISVDASGRFLLAMYEDGVRVVTLDGRTETLFDEPGATVW